MATTVTFEDFGGLAVDRSADAVGAAGATATSNLAFDIPGKLRTRDGYASFAAPTTAPTRLHILDATPVFHLITSSSTKLEAFDSGTGAAIASGTVTPGVGPHAMVTYGKPSTSVVYAVHPQDTLMRKWNGTAWSTVAGSKIGTGLAVSKSSNRLVVGGETDSTVWFSNAGDPETFGANNFVMLTPNDGESITTVQSFGDRLFVFKETKFFVFTNEAIDNDGEPVFNYYPLEGVGARNAAGPAVSTPNGIYFLADDGVYVTTGQTPVRIPGPLTRLLGGTDDEALAGWRSWYDHNLSWHRGRLFVQIYNGSGDSRVYVWHTVTGQWSQWSLMTTKTGGQFTGFGDRPDVFFANGTDNAVYKMSPTTTTVAGAAITFSYTSGKYGLAEPGNVATTLESSLRGTGTVTFQLDSEMYTGTPLSVALGTSPAVDEGWYCRDSEGRKFQHTISGTGVAQVESLTHIVTHVRGGY